MELTSNGVYLMTDDEIMAFAREQLPNYIYFENIKKGDITDDGFVGFEETEDCQVFECTACGYRWNEKGHTKGHKEICSCPECGNTETAYNRKYGRKSLKIHLNAVVLYKQDYDNIWAECIRVDAFDFSDIYCPNISVQQRAVYHFSPGVGERYRFTRFNGCEKMKSRKGYRFYTNQMTYYCHAEEFNVYQNGDISDSFLKYSGFEKFLEDDIEGDLLTYLMMYCEAPVFCEFWTKLDNLTFIRCKMDGTRLPREIKYRAKTVPELFGKLSKQELKGLMYWLSSAGEKVNDRTLGAAIKYVREKSADGFRRIVDIFGRLAGTAAEIILITEQSPVTLKNYLIKQKELGLLIYRDYINECKELNYDLSDSQVLYPKNLKEKHSETSALANHQTDPKEIARSKKRAAKLKKSGAEYKHKRLCAVIPESSLDIIREGAIQGHCVGRYAQKHADGKTTIIFIRKCLEADTPYFTLEIDMKNFKVIQCYGKKNLVSYKHNLEVEQFLEHYKRHLEYCRRLQKKQ